MSANNHRMIAAVEAITPQMARQYLEMSAGNRNINPHRLAVYVRARREGRWFLTHQGICFGWDGRMYDGHHRLYMIEEAEMTTPFLVVRGMDPAAAAFLDCGAIRTAGQALHMSGRGEYSSDIVSAAGTLHSFPTRSCRDSNAMIDFSELHAIIEAYHEPLTFGCRVMKQVKGASRASRILMARASMHVAMDVLERFCEVMRSGIGTEGESAATMYARFLLTTYGRSTRMMEIERYQKGQSCIKAFQESRKLTQLRSTAEDLYPIDAPIEVLLPGLQR